MRNMACVSAPLNKPLQRFVQPDKQTGEHVMPYILGWFLGIPVVVLVLLYLVFN